jgi:predicted DNA-binding transcriptional regulator AlpA
MIDTMTATQPVGLTEIGKMFNISRQRAYALTKKASFPAPIATLSTGRVWDHAEVETWGKAWDRTNQGGRPPKPRAAGPGG